MKPTVGDQLRSARESRGLTLEDAVKATNIRRAYLQELESDHPELLHSATQARGFLRLYAAYLGIPPAPLINAWENPAAAQEAEAAPEESAAAASETPAEETEDLADGEAPAPQAIDVPESVEAGAVSEWDAAAEMPEVKGEAPLSRWRAALQHMPKISQLFPAGKNRKGPETKGAQKETKKEALPEEKMPAMRASREIMADIGRALRERREALELTLSDAETFTNVKRMYLEAMESGQFERMPSTVQGRGMLNNYSHFLALDETWIMDAYAGALQSVRAEKEASVPPKPKPPLTVQLNIPEKWRRILNPDLLIGGLFIVGLFAFIIWGGTQVFSVSDPEATGAPSISEMLAQTPTSTATVTEATAENGTAQATAVPGVIVAEATPTVIATVNAAPLQLYIIVSDRAYLRVNVDGTEAFNGRVKADDVFTFSGENEITLLTGNGAALEVYFNQEYLGDMGNVGAVANLIFSSQGLSTPTPAPTATETPAPLSAESDALADG